MLGPLAIRVSPSKTPVRTDARRRSGAVDQHVPIDAATAAAKLSGQIRSSLSKFDAVESVASDGGVGGVGGVGYGINGQKERKVRAPKQAGARMEGQVQSNQGPAYGNGIEILTGNEKSHKPTRRGRKRSDKVPDPGMMGASPTIMSLLESILRDEA